MADAILVFSKGSLTGTEDGFYYDIFMEDGKITPDDFPKIEAEMKKVAKRLTRFSAVRPSMMRPTNTMRVIARLMAGTTSLSKSLSLILPIGR